MSKKDITGKVVKNFKDWKSLSHLFRNNLIN